MTLQRKVGNRATQRFLAQQAAQLSRAVIQRSDSEESESEESASEEDAEELSKKQKRIKSLNKKVRNRMYVIRDEDGTINRLSKPKKEKNKLYTSEGVFDEEWSTSAISDVELLQIVHQVAHQFREGVSKTTEAKSMRDEVIRKKGISFSYENKLDLVAAASYNLHAEQSEDAKHQHPRPKHLHRFLNNKSAKAYAIVQKGKHHSNQFIRDAGAYKSKNEDTETPLQHALKGSGKDTDVEMLELLTNYSESGRGGAVDWMLKRKVGSTDSFDDFPMTLEGAQAAARLDDPLRKRWMSTEEEEKAETYKPEFNNKRKKLYDDYKETKLDPKDEYKILEALYTDLCLEYGVDSEIEFYDKVGDRAIDEATLKKIAGKTTSKQWESLSVAQKAQALFFKHSETKDRRKKFKAYAADDSDLIKPKEGKVAHTVTGIKDALDDPKQDWKKYDAIRLDFGPIRNEAFLNNKDKKKRHSIYSSTQSTYTAEEKGIFTDDWPMSPLREDLKSSSSDSEGEVEEKKQARDRSRRRSRSRSFRQAGTLQKPTPSTAPKTSDRMDQTTDEVERSALDQMASPASLVHVNEVIRNDGMFVLDPILAWGMTPEGGEVLAEHDPRGDFRDEYLSAYNPMAPKSAQDNGHDLDQKAKTLSSENLAKLYQEKAGKFDQKIFEIEGQEVVKDLASYAMLEVWLREVLLARSWLEEQFTKDELKRMTDEELKAQIESKLLKLTEEYWIGDPDDEYYTLKAASSAKATGSSKKTTASAASSSSSGRGKASVRGKSKR